MCQRNSQLYQWNCYLYKYTRLIQVHLQVWLPWRRPKLLHSRRQVFDKIISAKADIYNVYEIIIQLSYTVRIPIF